MVNGQIFSFFFTVFCLPYTSLFSFQYDNLIKYQWIFTKPSICIDIVDTRFVICNRQISSFFFFFFFLFEELSAYHTSVFSFPDDNFLISKYQTIFTKLVMCFDIMEF